MKNKCIIWDWNGTLLDDVNICLETRNIVFPKFGLKPIYNPDEYRSLFCFPVKDYYKNSGVSDDIFNDVANAWINQYLKLVTQAKIRQDGELALQQIQKLKYNQIIISASRQDYLLNQVKHFGINNYFESILGLNNIYAKSKVQLAQGYIKNHEYSEYFLIGDTLHDYEVATEIGAKPILITGGHQSSSALKSIGATLISNINEVFNFI